MASPTTPTLPTIRRSKAPTKIETDHDDDDAFTTIYPISDRQKDSHTPKAGILSPTRRGTRGSVTDFADFLKTFNKQQQKTKAMLNDYQDEKITEHKDNVVLVPKLNIPTPGSSTATATATATASATAFSTASTAFSTASTSTALNTTPSPSQQRFQNMRHTISAASALQHHLKTGMKPRKYVEESYLAAAKARDRKRLATRLNMLGFPLDPCFQALKQSRNKASLAASLLLKWYPKGQGGRNLVQRMVSVIETSELKLVEAHDKIKSTMSDGTPAERLSIVSRFFIECDIGEKGYLTPFEFSNLSSNLGVELTNAELREAIMLIDEDGNGQVELVEYIEWWGDEEVLDQLINGGNKEGDGNTNKSSGGERKTTRRTTKEKKAIKSRTTDLKALRIKLTDQEKKFQENERQQLGRMSPSGIRNANFANKKSLGTQLTASDYLAQSMAMLQRHKNRKEHGSKASNNISNQIGMYSHIRQGGWFDKNGNKMSAADRHKQQQLKTSPTTDLNRQNKASKFATELGDNLAKMNNA